MPSELLTVFTSVTKLVVVPVVVAIVVMLLRVIAPDQKQLARFVTLAFSLVVLVQVVVIFFVYTTGQCPAGNVAVAPIAPGSPFVFLCLQQRPFFPWFISPCQLGLDGVC